ncbi:hypothetical protein KUCAC02_021247, partial [Chaenocephalus aceratus]
DEAEGAKKRPYEEISSEDEGPVVEDISGASVMEEKAPNCWSPEEVEDISEASGMEEGELGEDPGGAMVFGSPNDEQRGRGTRRN